MGATTGAVRTSVLANGVAHCFAGVVLGGLLALGASQILSSRVRDFGDLDFVTLSSVPSAFLVAAAIAAWIPARLQRESIRCRRSGSSEIVRVWDENPKLERLRRFPAKIVSIFSHFSRQVF